MKTASYGWIRCFLRVGGAALVSGIFAQSLIGQTLVQLGTFGGPNPSSHASGINNLGQVTGYSPALDNSWGSELPNNTELHAFVYSGGVMKDISPYFAMFSTGNAINDSGQVTGGFYSPSGFSHAFMCSGISSIDLSGPGNPNKFDGNDINNLGQVAGTIVDYGQNISGHAFLYSAGVISELGTLDGASSRGHGINDLGQVTGDSYTAGNLASHAFLYSAGAMSDLGTLGGTHSSGDSVNNLGQVTGVSLTVGDSALHAFLYSAGVMSDLGTLGGTYSAGYDINNLGQVVGVSRQAGDPNNRAFLYSGGVITDLNILYSDLLGDGVSSGFTRLDGAYGINDHGLIVGDGRYFDGATYSTRAFLLDPRTNPQEPSVPEGTATLGLFAAALAGLAGMRRRFAASA